MKMIAGAIVILAGAILLASTVIAEGFMLAANRVVPDQILKPAGIALGFSGFAILFWGLTTDRHRTN